ncbi:pyridoxamine 5'-phosphate oxidase family protein [Geobacter sp. SVR]|uniref:pyridoxamine 5'-phosphate oxidase family protein n=1 Tax=Geobacter sp. SVR TaxID=2495594 RepID=UPI00143EFABC|nr:pyridoxamine 5'-phosphate oxidase family protein [Geobacter sp. SVR]BCS52771.1 MFS transporter [Geobacter sp. SVR]GCF86637.1 MFS transporter [Geobacter sp. SVR]
MQKDLRRKDRALGPEEKRELLARGEYGVLSTVAADGAPYGVPVSYCLMDEALYFHCAVEGHKLDNIAANSSVSFCVVGTTELLPDQFATRYESVIVSGRGEEVFGTEKQRALEELVVKYSHNFMSEGQRYIEAHSGQTRVFRIGIADISGKARR